MRSALKPSLEHQFLPAVLEIQDTPPSPIGRAIIWSIAIFFISALVWASLSDVDIVAVASGRIIPNGHVKIIQPLEIGTLVAIHVKEGQAVRQGARLIDLESSSVDAEIARLSAEQALAEQQCRRLLWFVEQQDASEATPIDRSDPVLHSQWREYHNRLDTLQSEKNKRRAEYAAAGQQAQKLEAILPIINQRSANEKILVDQSLFPKQQYLETEQQRLTALFDLNSQHDKVEELKQALAEIDARIAHTRSDFAKINLENLEQIEARLAGIEQDLITAESRQKARHLAAPIDGIVQQLAVHTVGGVVTPAQELMVIVPQNTQLEIEATIANKDIGFIAEGQPAAIKLDAFPYTRYGTLAGSIVNLSNDAVTDQDKGLIYKARVGLEQTFIQVDGKPVLLGPGMAAKVEIKTGKRPLIEFFLAPLLQYRDESIRER